MQISDTTKRNQESSVGKLASCLHVRDKVFNASAATFVCCLQDRSDISYSPNGSAIITGSQSLESR